jgi:hypothetical protein
MNTGESKHRDLYLTDVLVRLSFPDRHDNRERKVKGVVWFMCSVTSGVQNVP